jgi:hypothetical protein
MLLKTGDYSRLVLSEDSLRKTFLEKIHNAEQFTQKPA